MHENGPRIGPPALRLLCQSPKGIWAVWWITRTTPSPLSLSLSVCVCVCVARGFFCFLLLTVWWYCRPVCVGRACSVKKNKQKKKAKTRRPLFFLFFGQFEERVPRAAVHSFDGHHFFSQQWFSFFGLYQLLRGFFFKPNSQRGASNWKDQLRFSRLKNFFYFGRWGRRIPSLLNKKCSPRIQLYSNIQNFMVVTWFY